MSTGKKILAAAIAVIIIFGLITAVVMLNKNRNDVDTVEYKGETYVYLQFPGDIFYYDLNKSIECAEDEKYPIESKQGDMVYVNGDLFCIKDKVESASAYYADDSNYKWYLVVETLEDDEIYPLEFTEGDLKYIYGMEEMERDKALFFDDIERFGCLKKVSGDGLICGQTQLAYYKGKWYWRSEIIDESQEADGTWPEYVQPMPDCLNEY